MTGHLRRIILAVGLVTMLALVAAPAPAEAQWYGHARFHVSFGGYWPYPYWGPYWGPSFGFGFGYPWGPYPYYRPYGYPFWGYPGPYYYGWDPSGTARLQVTPREAKVFVDGYAAGVVDDFDGTFQRLRTQPGGHEITVYLDGYRTVRQTVYLRPDSTTNLKFAMEPLAAGETSEPPPPPQPRSSRGGEDPDEPGRPQNRPPSRGEPPPGPPSRGEPDEQPAVRYGTLVVVVQPADAEIFIDGERWQTTTPGYGSSQRLTIRLTEGRHRIEIRKEGFATFAETIGIGLNRTMTLNVSLNK